MYGCVQCYWFGNIPEDCNKPWQGHPDKELCCPECGNLAYDTEELVSYIGKLLNLYVTIVNEENK